MSFYDFSHISYHRDHKLLATLVVDLIDIDAEPHSCIARKTDLFVILFLFCLPFYFRNIFISRYLYILACTCAKYVYSYFYTFNLHFFINKHVAYIFVHILFCPEMLTENLYRQGFLLAGTNVSHTVPTADSASDGNITVCISPLYPRHLQETPELLMPNLDYHLKVSSIYHRKNTSFQLDDWLFPRVGRLLKNCLINSDLIDSVHFTLIEVRLNLDLISLSFLKRKMDLWYL